MPVLAESHNPGPIRSHQLSTNRNTNTSTYLLLSLAIVLAVGFRIGRQKERNKAVSNQASETKRRISEKQTMEEAPIMSALPEKPYLPGLESASHTMECEPATSETDVPETTSTSNSLSVTSSSASLEQPTPQSFFQHRTSNLPKSSISAPQSPRTSQSSAAHSSPTTISNTKVSLTVATTKSSLLYPGPPSPTIALNLTPMNIHTQIPFQAQEYQFEDQPQYEGQYFQNEILFVPSPTEYTSFEALYSKFPPPIYHDAPNPTSYTSFEAPVSESGSESQHPLSSSFSTTDGNPDYQLETTLPRRRSYMKTLSNGSEMSGEIVISASKNEGNGGGVGGQWRRHTKVFGGGVCVACEESESRRMSA